MVEEIAFETILGCERCNYIGEAHLQYSPNEDKELYLCNDCAMKEFKSAKTIKEILGK